MRQRPDVQITTVTQNALFNFNFTAITQTGSSDNMALCLWSDINVISDDLCMCNGMNNASPME